MTQPTFTEEQIADFQEAFSLFDKDVDGYLTADEVGVAIRSVIGAISEEELKQVNHKERVDFPEFLILISRIPKSAETSDDNENDVMLEALALLDKTNSGVISVKLLRHVLTSMGEMMTKEETDELLKEVDRDGTGLVNYKEFVKMMTS